MDNLTHSLVGAILGQAGLKKKTGLAMPALIIGANLPDVDATCFFWLDGVEQKHILQMLKQIQEMKDLPEKIGSQMGFTEQLLQG